MKTKLGIIVLLFLLALITTLKGQDMERKGYIGTMLGPSFPLGEFASKETFFDGYAKTGVNIHVLTFGYRIWKNFGITSAWFGMANPIDYYGLEGMWGIGAITLGPMYSINLSKKTTLDLKVMSGYVYESRDLDVDNYAYAYGPGYNAGIMLRYDFTKLWCFMFNIEAFNTGLDIQPSRDPEVTLLNLSLGIAYKLK